MAAPIGINVDQYRTQAKELLSDARLSRPEAMTRFKEHHPERSTGTAFARVKLADAQLVIARENGFASWPRFVEYLHFRNAVAALDAGDLPRLEALIDAHPSLLRYACRVGEWYEQGYFAGATLLWHIAGNPIRGPLPRNILAIARVLVDRHFTGEDARNTIGLLLTSKQASEAGVALPMIDLLTRSGARFDLDAPDALDAPLLNHAPDTAEALVHRGATPQLRHSAALGDVVAMRRMLGEPVDQTTLDDALVFACIRGQRDAAALLVARGANGGVLLTPGGQTPRTALHEAANRGYAEIVELLIAAGASALVVEPRWNGTAAGWAQAGGFTALAERLCELGQSGRQ
ncbi:MAG TPA: ankyrin repeat domain-containing protein [Gemmatimonadaceae bacterium]|nr:ankyrin repeat domain-containing protein [Gemmatimonadaceae bacterium]